MGHTAFPQNRYGSRSASVLFILLFFCHGDGENGTRKGDHGAFNRLVSRANLNSSEGRRPPFIIDQLNTVAIIKGHGLDLIHLRGYGKAADTLSHGEGDDHIFVFVINKWTRTFHLSHKQVVQPHLSQKQVDLKSDQTSTQQTFRVGGSVK